MRFYTPARPPDRSAACVTTSHARLSLFFLCTVVHLVRYCHTSCSTAHCLAGVDWLTCGISSAATTTASGIGKPFLFGARVHRSNRRAYACASYPLCTRPPTTRHGPSTYRGRSSSALHCRPLRYTSSRQWVSERSYWSFSSRPGMADSVVLPRLVAPNLHPSTPLAWCCPSAEFPYPETNTSSMSFIRLVVARVPDAWRTWASQQAGLSY